MTGRSVIVAKNAGFCFGVRRATELIEREIASGEKIRIFTLGKLIHNDSYNRRLAKAGVCVIGTEDVERIAESTLREGAARVFVRAHGMTRETDALLHRCAEEYPDFTFTDCTCPYVKKIHRIATENSVPDPTDGRERIFILIGSASHPEVVGVVSYFEGRSFVCSTADELKAAAERGELPYGEEICPVIAAQTTQNTAEWKKSINFLKKLYTNPIIFDTICNVTENRQTEAAEIAKKCDAVVVIGGNDSSNTSKLYSICLGYCPCTVRVETAEQLAGKIPNDRRKVGIVAGASTPGDIIEEVHKTMSETIIDNVENVKETENFDEMLNSAFKTLNSGDTVTGTVIAVNDIEIKLDLGAKVTGILTADQISDDASLKLSREFRIGDQIDVFIIRVSDIDGCATVSKKRADLNKNWHKLVEAKESGETLEGKVSGANAAGLTVSLYGARIFIPASQSGCPKDADLTALVGETVKFKVIDVKSQSKKDVIGSIRAAAREERKVLADKFWEEIEVGKQYTGKVRGMTDYGAFIDLGGVDGMLHKKEISWKPIHKPADVLNIGDEITVFIKSYDPETRKISLGYRTEESHPWNVFKAQYAVDDVIDVTISNIMSYGAFARITDDVDGLIHVSQIARTRVENPADVLTSGQQVRVKIIKVDDEQQRVSLSIRALLEEEEADETDEAPADAE
ncbi:MAG: 4-hydroxy-3-methylbut-2-enyl diphosphate reductase [Clostridia bacterium]|nr:4-hydroxy-3-methylbut-2-enyl diphosphate reductase [Clostridia bacterium]